MNIAHAKIFSYALPLWWPLPPAAGGAPERRGWLLQVTADGGAVDYGDIAPLPGFSRETPKEARAQLEAIAELLPAVNPWPDAPSALLERTARELPRACAASVRFGVETALLNLLATIRGTPWHRELGRSWQPLVAVNALAGGAERDVARAAQQAVADGFRCLKLKVGHLSVAAATATVRQAQAAADGKLALRVDANRGWSLDEALAFAAGAADAGIEYVEEPVARAEDLAAFRAAAGLRVAIDESLSLSPPPAADVWIIKPTLRGGVAATLALANAARAAGVMPVISSAFETGVGLCALFQLAALTHDAGTPAGLGTGAWFARDVLAQPLRVVNGTVDVDRDIAFPTRLVDALSS